MVVHRYFAHEGPGGSVDSRISRAGYLSQASAFAIGENIGGGRGRRCGSPMAVFEEWMHSPPHRANILDPSFRDAGVGVARGFPLGGRCRRRRPTRSISAPAALTASSQYRFSRTTVQKIG